MRPTLAFIFAATICIGQLFASTTVAASETTAPQSTLVPCEELPTGNLTEEQLARFAPEGSKGRVRIAWKTESQTETYGFNILRAENPDGPYKALNAAIIPGEGTSNVPTAYCFEDRGPERGKAYYYQIEEVTTTGDRNIVEGTAATKVQVKTIAEEREWLKRRAAAAPQQKQPE